MELITIQKNQNVICENGTCTFFSYGSQIAKITNQKNNNLKFTNLWHYSQTTLKYLYLFLNEYKYNLSNDIYQKVLNALDSNNKKASFQKLINNRIINLEA